ncbi:MAG: phosphatase PAP2 family protein [Arenicella sp.]|nr:phosphatase PAP2 family protein [Arenicella sp.]
MMIILALGYWLWGKGKFTRVAILVLVSTIFNAFLKDLWENPRPDLMFRLDGQVGNSFGMPSGHAQVSAVLWFWIAYEIRKIWAWMAATVVVAGICFSRIYLGIHDLEDILAGLSIAVISLFVFRLLLTSKLQPLIEAPLVFWLVAIVVSGVIAHSVWPSAEHSIGAISVFGLLFSWCIGAKIEPSLVAYAPHKKVWSLVLTGAIGILGLMILLAAVKPVLSGFEPLLAATINAALLGVYVTLVAPMLFKLCKLSAQA